jgi:hypothetical protein
MGTETMGRVTVAAKIENVGDLCMVEKGVLPHDEVHRIEVSDALVDTGATTLSMPKKLIEQLGLIPYRSRTARSDQRGCRDVPGLRRRPSDGSGAGMHGRRRRSPHECPVLIGQVPLQLLDFVVDPAGRRLIGNPAHGGEPMLEMYEKAATA